MLFYSEIVFILSQWENLSVLAECFFSLALNVATFPISDYNLQKSIF